MPPLRALTALLIAAFVVAAILRVPSVLSATNGRDAATFVYAARAVAQSADPYDRAALAERAQADGQRASVYPYLYPPTFLIVARPLGMLPLRGAYLAMAALSVLATLALLGLAGRAPQPAAVLAALLAAIGSNVLNNAAMGQVNLPALALTVGGAALVLRGRSATGGALVGLAVAIKLFPALLVFAWLARGRWRAVGWALSVVAALGAASVLLDGVAPWRAFVFGVLPSLRTGAYGGLGLPVVRFGNHGLPEWWARALGADGLVLSPAAQLGSALTAAGIAAVLVVAWRRPPSDALAEVARWCALLVVPLLLAVFTWEHHLVWAAPALVVLGVGAAHGRLARWEVALLVAAILAWAVDLTWLRALVEVAPPWLDPPLRESKTVALLIVLGLSARLGAREHVGAGAAPAVAAPSGLFEGESEG